MDDTTDVPVTRAELQAEAERIIERDGMPDEATALAELVLGYLDEVEEWLEHRRTECQMDVAVTQADTVAAARWQGQADAFGQVINHMDLAPAASAGPGTTGGDPT